VEYVVLASEERGGLVYQLCAPQIAESALQFSETIELSPVVVVRKELSDANPDAGAR
jgi:hypothetical protein